MRLIWGFGLSEPEGVEVVRRGGFWSDWRRMLPEIWGRWIGSSINLPDSRRRIRIHSTANHAAWERVAVDFLRGRRDGLSFVKRTRSTELYRGVMPGLPPFALKTMTIKPRPFDRLLHILLGPRNMRVLRSCAVLARGGFAVCRPLCLFEEWRAGLFERSVFISAWDQDARSVFDLLSSTRDIGGLRERRTLLRWAAREIARVHAAGIAYGDMNLHNLLAQRKEGGWRFVWVDTEGTQARGRLSARRRAKNLSQLISHAGPLSRRERLMMLGIYGSRLNCGRGHLRYLAREAIRRRDRHRFDGELPCCRALPTSA